MKQSDIVIIGAGIAGLTSAIYLKRANADFVILENTLPGGMLNSLKEVENYPGFKKTSGKDILLSLMEQIKSLGIKVTYGSVQTILKDQGGFKVVSDNESYIAKAIIVASGFSLKNEMIKGEKEFAGRGVSYCATCDGNFFKDDEVVIYGSGETAFEEASYLSSLVKTLHFVLPEEVEQKLKKENVIYHFGKIKEIKGDDFGVTSVITENEEIMCHGVFPYIGSKVAGEFLLNLKPTMNGSFVVTDENMKTDIEGLFAAGDIRQKSLKQLVTAASDGAIAAIEANKYVKS